MKKPRFDEYIRHFNEEDSAEFEDFFQTDLRMRNGTLVYYCVAGWGVRACPSS
jgi:hypothetical protein